MRKHIKKALRIPFHSFYLSSDDSGTILTKIKTKKRMKDLLESNKFVQEIYRIESNYSEKDEYAGPKSNSTIIFRKRF